MINLEVDKMHLLSPIGCFGCSVSFAVEFDVTVIGKVGVETPPFSKAPSEAGLDAEVEVVVVDVHVRVIVLAVVLVFVEVVVVLGVVVL